MWLLIADKPTPPLIIHSYNIALQLQRGGGGGGARGSGPTSLYPKGLFCRTAGEGVACDEEGPHFHHPPCETLHMF